MPSPASVVTLRVRDPGQFIDALVQEPHVVTEFVQLGAEGNIAAAIHHVLDSGSGKRRNAANSSLSTGASNPVVFVSGHPKRNQLASGNTVRDITSLRSTILELL
jgi:hypothetical protein